MSKIAPFKRPPIVWEIRIAEDLPECLYGITIKSDESGDVFLIGMYARSWEEAERVRPKAEDHAWEEYRKQLDSHGIQQIRQSQTR